MYVIDSEKLTKRPEIRIGDKIYEIDNRLSAYERINERVKAADGGEFEIIIGEAPGGENFAEIVRMDLPFGTMQDIVVIILAAIQDLTVEEARARFRAGKQ
ncbi:MAG: hypothetical protein LBE55_03295 [Clostridiales bacterium]|jgi:hypothetical protein|nr:hypothetical protein [Clostridiales bacterium]